MKPKCTEYGTPQNGNYCLKISVDQGETWGDDSVVGSYDYCLGYRDHLKYSLANLGGPLVVLYKIEKIKRNKK